MKVFDRGIKFSERLTEIMKERGENQTTLARKITARYDAIQRQTISLYMSGKSKPDSDRISAIAVVLDVSADWLLGLSSKKEHDVSISEYTGLAEESIEAIRRLDKDALAGLNAFLSGMRKEAL